MLQITVCDDNRRDLKNCADQIRQCADKNKIEIELSCYESAESLLFDLYECGHHADILYLDIIMEKTSGMDAAQAFRDQGSHAQIVFLTSTPDYMGQAFDVEAVQYLIKGKITEEEFEQTFLRAVNQVESQKDTYFVCEFNSSVTSIPFRCITYFEVINRKILLHHTYNSEPVCFYGKMSDLEEDLSSEEFLRIHRSYLVHLPYIARFCSQKVVLQDTTELPIGRKYIDMVKGRFCHYITQNHIYLPKGGIKL